MDWDKGVGARAQETVYWFGPQGQLEAFGSSMPYYKLPDGKVDKWRAH
jgi:hypothetical protein